ncbi:hypothetical protein [Agrococcus sp. Marseille-P2731]|uniref:hypothetical protein n=1 Tax=Agrococcus sp. Marseille-P2731 TaxID=1841862 RepID=UPI00093199C6|nr:hypothetical protein [Agrococcus sp. Marseille-P2731]
MARTTRIALLVASALLLTGCATSAATQPESAPEPSHTMPDGTVMSGAEHDHGAEGEEPAEHGDAEHAEHGDDAHAASAGDPSPAAQMICAGQVVNAVTSLFDLEGEAVGTPSWDAPMYSCTYEIDGAPLRLSVHDTADVAAGEAHFTGLQSTLAGAEEIEGMLGLGLPSFSTGEGIVAFIRDGKTLLVDATALPDGFAGSMTHDGAAYAVASAVLNCWVEHD